MESDFSKELEKVKNTVTLPALSPDRFNVESVEDIAQSLQRLAAEFRGVSGIVHGIVHNAPDTTSAAGPEEAKLYAQTPIVSSDYVFSATSKAARMQNEIARGGDVGTLVNVGSKTDPVEILVRITDKDGNPLVLLEGAKQLQDVIAGMIQENGLPLYVTAAQIFRRYTGRPADSTVTPQEIEDIDNGIQYLRQTSAYINYEQQVKKHTSLKRRDELLAKGAEIDAPLVLAERAIIIARNGERVPGYNITAMPILCKYSWDIAQVMRYPRKLLQTTAPRKTAAGRCSNAMRVAIIKRFLLDEINVAARVADKEKRKRNIVQCNIDLDTVFKRCDVEDTPKLRRTVRELIEKILDEWRTGGESILRKWEAIYDNRKITGYILTLKPEKTEWRM